MQNAGRDMNKEAAAPAVTAALPAAQAVIVALPAGWAVIVTLPAAPESIITARGPAPKNVMDENPRAAAADAAWIPLRPDTIVWEDAPPGEWASSLFWRLFFQK